MTDLSRLAEAVKQFERDFEFEALPMTFELALDALLSTLTEHAEPDYEAAMTFVRRSRPEIAPQYVSDPVWFANIVDAALAGRVVLPIREEPNHE